MTTFIKDPNASLDYGIDWTAWLAGDTIAVSSWLIPSASGLIRSAALVNAAATTSTVWLAGGVVSETPWTVTNRITTVGGRKDDRSFMIIVQNR